MHYLARPLLNHGRLIERRMIIVFLLLYDAINSMHCFKLTTNKILVFNTTVIYQYYDFKYFISKYTELQILALVKALESDKDAFKWLVKNCLELAALSDFLLFRKNNAREWLDIPVILTP